MALRVGFEKQCGTHQRHYFSSIIPLWLLRWQISDNLIRKEGCLITLQVIVVVKLSI